VAQLVERVGGVGDQLPEKDLRVRVKRVDDELKELRDFGLELVLGHNILIIAKNSPVGDMRLLRESKSGHSASYKC
jgi:hypothetical protein